MTPSVPTEPVSPTALKSDSPFSTNIVAPVWSVERAREWHNHHGWLVGCNYAPAYAINQLEMWQAETFDMDAIDRELSLAESLGFNSLRVFLHNLLWQQDRDGFFDRLNRFLEAAQTRGIGAMLVPFDGVWGPHPEPGPQPAPRIGLHNSGWTQAPGAIILKDLSRHEEMKPYILDLLCTFGQDPRVQIWDLFNEPDNPNTNAFHSVELEDKAEKVLAFLEKLFVWAREANPSQPVTVGVWYGRWTHARRNAVQNISLANSDVLSFHNYETVESMAKNVADLRVFSPGRPLLCTEYMARGNRSYFNPHLDWMKQQEIGAYNWGFVAGKSQTIYPWDSYRQAYDHAPPVWFHDIFRPDGTPYIEAEVAYIRQVTGAGS